MSHSQTVTLAEDTAVGFMLYDSDATDLDLGIHGKLHYAITAGNPGNVQFVIDENDGRVFVGSFLDFDTAPLSYTLTLTVYDNDGQVT